MATALAYNNNLLRMGNMAFAMLTPPPPPPFDVVSDSDFDASYQLTYDSIPDLHLWDSDGNEYSV